MESTNESRHAILANIKNAFDFIQKLYNESSYLIKEIEGQLAISDLKFQILKPSGYGIISRTSSGLEMNLVSLWLLRKFAVAFVEESFTKSEMGMTCTKVEPLLKVLYFRVILNDKIHKEPQLLFGVFYEIKKKKEDGKKFEYLMSYFETNDHKIFDKISDIFYENPNFEIKGKFKKVNLLDINSSEELVKKVIEPALKIYLEIGI